MPNRKFALFTPADTWYGGFYELAIELGDTSDERLLAALNRIWSYPKLDGCYLDTEVEPGKQPRVAVPTDITELWSLRGIAELPTGERIACGTFVVREDEGPDWVGFYIPMGALSLSLSYEVGGYPFDVDLRSHKEWQQELDSWLADLGAFVFRQVPYRLGIIGHDVSGDTYADDIEKQGIPDDRFVGYLWPEGHEIKYLPMNRQYGQPENLDDVPSRGSLGHSLRGVAKHIGGLVRGRLSK